MDVSRTRPPARAAARLQTPQPPPPAESCRPAGEASPARPTRPRRCRRRAVSWRRAAWRRATGRPGRRFYRRRARRAQGGGATRPTGRRRARGARTASRASPRREQSRAAAAPAERPRRGCVACAVHTQRVGAGTAGVERCTPSIRANTRAANASECSCRCVSSRPPVGVRPSAIRIWASSYGESWAELGRAEESRGELGRAGERFRIWGVRSCSASTKGRASVPCQRKRFPS